MYCYSQWQDKLILIINILEVSGIHWIAYDNLATNSKFEIQIEGIGISKKQNATQVFRDISFFARCYNDNITHTKFSHCGKKPIKQKRNFGFVSQKTFFRF